MFRLLLVVVLMALAMPAVAHCGPDGGLHDHLDVVFYVATVASMAFGLFQCKVRAWFKK
jgi:hypothetical protein